MLDRKTNQNKLSRGPTGMSDLATHPRASRKALEDAAYWLLTAQHHASDVERTMPAISGALPCASQASTMQGGHTRLLLPQSFDQKPHQVEG